MPDFKIAHIRQQEQDMVIVPLTPEFEHKTPTEKRSAIDELQVRSQAAGLAGTVVPAWLYQNRVHFIAPEPWHPFFQSLTWNQILASVNKELRW
jgi:hypothetical protein